MNYNYLIVLYSGRKEKVNLKDFQNMCFDKREKQFSSV